MTRANYIYRIYANYRASMFTHQGLFKSLACPDRDTCNRPHCLYSHASNIPYPRFPQFIIKVPPPITVTQPAIPIKRPVVQTTSPPTPEPPRKFQKVGTSQRPLAIPSASHSEVRSIYIYIYCLTLISILVWRTNLEGQCCSISGRCSCSTGLSFPFPCKSHLINSFGQTMLKTLYDHFVVLYKAILPDNPSLASEHALKQEEDVYKVSSKLTYRNASLIILALSWTYIYL
jgi:RNA exonuclease 1